MKKKKSKGLFKKGKKLGYSFMKTPLARAAQGKHTKGYI